MDADEHRRVIDEPWTVALRSDRGELAHQRSFLRPMERWLVENRCSLWSRVVVESFSPRHIHSVGNVLADYSHTVPCRNSPVFSREWLR